MKRLLLALCLAACGGAQPPPAHEIPPQPSASPPPVEDAGPPAVSVVRYDDLGISFGVPSDFHVVGDDELAARIRSSASPRLQADLAAHANAKKGIPLLVLRQDTPDRIEVTLSVSVAPADATPEEVITHTQAALSTNFPDFTVTGPATPLTVDGVSGMKLAGYIHERSACQVRVFVRNGVETFLVAYWPKASDAAAAVGTRVLEGLHFYSP